MQRYECTSCGQSNTPPIVCVIEIPNEYCGPADGACIYGFPRTNPPVWTKVEQKEMLGPPTKNTKLGDLVLIIDVVYEVVKTDKHVCFSCDVPCGKLKDAVGAKGFGCGRYTCGKGEQPPINFSERGLRFKRVEQPNELHGESTPDGPLHDKADCDACRKPYSSQCEKQTYTQKVIEVLQQAIQRLAGLSNDTK